MHANGSVYRQHFSPEQRGEVLSTVVYLQPGKVTGNHKIRRMLWAVAWYRQLTCAYLPFGSVSSRKISVSTGQKSSGIGGISLPFGSGAAGGGGGSQTAGLRLQPGVPLPTWILDTVQVSANFV